MKQARKQVNTPTVAVLPTEGNEQTLVIVQNAEAKNVPSEDYKVIGSETKKTLNLDETISVVQRLYMKMKFRDRLDMYIDLLNSLEIELAKEDLNKDNPYQGCTLVITDDRHGKFTLANPTLISETVDFLSTRMKNKLGEIEAELVLPN